MKLRLQHAYRLVLLFVVCSLTLNLVGANANVAEQEIEGSLLSHLGTWIGMISKLDCALCQDAVLFAQRVVLSKTPMDVMTDIVIKGCELLHIEDKTVCEGIIPLFSEEFMTVLTDRLLDPNMICSSALMHHACPRDKRPTSFDVRFPKPKPAHVPPTPPAPGAPRKRILHMTDMHFDPDYFVGSNANCGEPLCCRANNGPGEGQFKAGLYGHYLCDAPRSLLNNLFDHLAQQELPDYIFWTGDNPSHHVWSETRESKNKVTEMLTSMFLERFGQKVQVFTNVGNHESVPVNSFPAPPANSWLLTHLANDWSKLGSLPESALNSVRYGGYYTTLAEEGLRIVSLNMNYCNNGNFWLYLNDTDPAGQLQWLIDTLQLAEDNKEKVYILGHIPPGVGNCLITYSRKLHQIVDRYEDTILAQFYGHTHMDHFEVFYDYANNSRPISIAYIAPSVTTYQRLNPGYRVYDIDAQSKYVVDHQTYIFNLTEANASNVTNWQLEYSAQSAYNMTDLFPSSWAAVADRMSTDDALLNKFLAYKYKSYVEGNPSAVCTTDKCKKLNVCKLKSGSFSDVVHCMGGIFNFESLLVEIEDKLC